MVMTQEIDKIPVKDLQTKYNIGRSALYERFKHANVKPNKEGTRSFVSGEQLSELDRLHNHLEGGGTFEDFESLSTTGNSQEAISLNSSPNSSLNVHRTNSWEAEREPLLEVLIDAMKQSFHYAITYGVSLPNAGKPVTAIDRHQQLKVAAEEGWLLTTLEVKELIGVKPQAGKGENKYTRGSWTFIKSGKIGRGTAWRVERSMSPENRMKRIEGLPD
ncbi:MULTISPECIES: hypothetical protein [unclassified Moorena]|uniref:hypothetical protein n=1 Tax=unclassified Moorena TaxID=2683338 RepID=UPI0014189620|nr:MULTISPECIES: hypothetical protein [unclassified Moorena]NEO17276.1 hypothetical protein [Moorena sp. SIO3E8]